MIIAGCGYDHIIPPQGYRGMIWSYHPSDPHGTDTMAYHIYMQSSTQICRVTTSTDCSSVARTSLVPRPIPSLVPRLLPVFQCYTQKNGGAWYLIARDLRVQERPTV